MPSPNWTSRTAIFGSGEKIPEEVRRRNSSTQAFACVSPSRSGSLIASNSRAEIVWMRSWTSPTRRGVKARDQPARPRVHRRVERGERGQRLLHRVVPLDLGSAATIISASGAGKRSLARFGTTLASACRVTM
jgi:hypothetical protein